MAVGLKLKHNLDEVLDTFEQWEQDVLNVALPRATTKLAEQAQVAGLRAISRIYRIGPRIMDKYLTLKPANAADMTAIITARNAKEGQKLRGTGFPFYLFKPRAVRGVGVSVEIKGRRILVKHAFIQRMKSGHYGVFARGAYGGKGKISPTGEKFGRFHFGKYRYSINELFTFGPPEALLNRHVNSAMDDRIEEQMGKVINAEIRFATR